MDMLAGLGLLASRSTTESARAHKDSQLIQFVGQRPRFLVMLYLLPLDHVPTATLDQHWTLFKRVLEMWCSFNSFDFGASSVHENDCPRLLRTAQVSRISARMHHSGFTCTRTSIFTVTSSELQAFLFSILESILVALKMVRYVLGTCFGAFKASYNIFIETRYPDQPESPASPVSSISPPANLAHRLVLPPNTHSTALHQPSGSREKRI